MCDWTTFNSQLLNFYRTDSYAIINIVVQKKLDLSREINENGSHSDFVLCVQFSIKIREQQHNSPSPFKSSVDLD